MTKLFSSLESTKCFTNLNAYKTVYPSVVSCLETLYTCNSDNKDLLNILSEAKCNCIDILNNLAIGYNRYNIKDKLYFYNLSRNCLSKVQSLLILLNSFNILNFEKTDLFVKKFQEDLKLFNGTIRKIENLEKK
jgi:hypothetical protein